VKAEEIKRTLDSSGVLAEGQFGISTADEVHVMRILRDTLYSDNILAVIREYSANAWDAHREAGKPKLPIKVTLPRPMFPTLKVRDFGLGLSEQDVFNIYTQYGASGSRASNNAVGMLGIGSKSAFAYTESFLITSWHKGTKKIYSAALDEEDRGKMLKLHEGTCKDSETGVEIQVAVNPEDLELFENKAQELFQYFDPVPDINTTVTAVVRDDQLPQGYIARNSADWVAIMGCVPYEMDLNIVATEIVEEGYERFHQHLGGGLFFDIGTVDISANREELRYTPRTKKAIVTRIVELGEAYIEKVMSVIAAKNQPFWVKRLEARHLVKDLDLALPKMYKMYTAARVELFGKELPKTFNFWRMDYHKDRKQTNTVPVGEYSRIVIHNRSEPLKDISFQETDRIVTMKPFDGNDMAAVNNELNALIIAADIVGIEMVASSQLSLNYPKPLPQVVVPTNKKHRVRSFRLKASAYDGRVKKSDNWAIEKRTPGLDDVFVIIHKFKPTVKTNNLHMGLCDVRDFDKKMAEALQAPFPDIYGYKTTARKVIKEADCEGAPYREWREKYFATVADTIPEVRQLIEWHITASAYSSDYAIGVDRGDNIIQGYRLKRDVAKIATALGATHPIVVMFKRYQEAHEGLRAYKKQSVKDCLAFLAGCKGVAKCLDRQMLETVFDKYPLIRSSGRDLFKVEHTQYEDWKYWIEYIQLADKGSTHAVHHQRKLHIRRSPGNSSGGGEGSDELQGPPKSVAVGGL
jgi:hypothetical protein